MRKVFSLPPFGTNAWAGHRFAAMPRRIEQGEPLFQG
jgi:hypothetical protein